MLNEKQIKNKLELVDNMRYVYNGVFISGYKQALEEVLEIERPKARPASKDGIKMKCPHCLKIFLVAGNIRNYKIQCPWCSSIVEEVKK